MARHADRFWKIRPGANYALNQAIIHEILVACKSCRTEYATEIFLTHLESKLPESLKAAPMRMRQLCFDCARDGFAEVLNAE